jgi:soluble lytic murein transglycosylase-like protein
VEGTGFPPVRPGVDVGPEQRLERARLDAVFARHYDIPIDLAGRIHDAAREAGLDPVLAFGLVETESSFRRTAVSWAGAVGYTQVMPATARWMDPRVRRSDLFEADTNLKLGFDYLSYLMDYYDGDVRLALTAYNRGPGTVDGLLKRGRDPENGYADKVLGTTERRVLRRG